MKIHICSSKKYENSLYESQSLVDNAIDFGIRGYIANNFQDISYYKSGDRKVFKNNKELGDRAFNKAVKFSKSVIKKNNSLINTFLFPYTTETCTNELLKKSFRASKDLGIPLRTHFAQYKSEIEHTYKNFKKTPLERLKDLNILDQNLTLTHCIYLNSDLKKEKFTRDQLNILSDTTINLSQNKYY